jgi:hypothetical protein
MLIMTMLALLLIIATPSGVRLGGGELLIATTKSEKQHRSGLEHRWEDEYLLAEGHGLYIACKPNRIVLQKPGTWHAINRVDSDAGDHLRVSIVAFFE